ncbi:MAG: ketol-acid reductoisomerase [Acidobacteriota bacterium]
MTLTQLESTDREPTTESLQGRRVAVLGYGSQGRAQALNLRDSGVDVTLGLRREGASWRQAVDDGWLPLTVEAAVSRADVVAMLVPDMIQPELFENAIRPRLQAGSALLFSHGFNIHYGAITGFEGFDVVMVAPKGPGNLVREQYQQGRGVPCLVAVHHDASGRAAATARAYGNAIGGGRAGLLETSFREETETDLFGEQAVLCGGATELVTAGWETLVDAGYSPEVAYFECLHELKLIVDLLYEGGLERMHRFVSDTASYGDLTRGPRVIDAGTRERMRQILGEIQDGTFAREWRDEHAQDGERYQALKKARLAHPIEGVGRKLRARLAWLRQREDAAA